MCTYGLSTMRSSQLIGVVIADDDDDGGDRDFSMPTILTLIKGSPKAKARMNIQIS